MADDSSIPHPPAEARQPTVDVEEGIPFRNTDQAPGDDTPDRAFYTSPAAPEPKIEDLGARSFAGQNVANDMYQHPDGRDPGLDGGSTANREARHPAQSDGEVPEDDLD
ncbi:MAG: hypothetical protein M3154_08195 [Candidatus Eremiobacteraeota bacterium]|nr:hypothetical protein [Candidatus Eremiobacteraeota bacterium]